MSPVHHGAVRKIQGRILKVTRSNVAIFQQARKSKAHALFVALRMGEIVVTTNEISDNSVLLQNV